MSAQKIRNGIVLTSAGGPPPEVPPILNEWNENIVWLKDQCPTFQMRTVTTTLKGRAPNGDLITVYRLINIRDTTYTAEYEWRGLTRNVATQIARVMNSTFTTAGVEAHDGLKAIIQTPYINEDIQPPVIAYRTEEIMMGGAQSTYESGSFWSVHVNINYTISTYEF